MNKTAILIVAILSATALISFLIYTENTRYIIQSTSKGVAYKIDRKTGQTWLIVGSQEKIVEGARNSKTKRSSEDIAIEFVKNSYALGGYSSVDSQIRSWLKKKKAR